MMLASCFYLSSCGINHALIVNDNQISTQVQLNTNNFEVVQKVKGSADVEYILTIGGVNRKQLYENAYANMLTNADLMNGSKAIVNVLTEEHLGGFPPFYYRRTITVSAHVIEFTR
ncbi:MAG: hypothetical protein HKN87_15380 [Saprospiraceae bacterium]|nr:hypothetical protein [Saprospiraceae bacterium]